jgi:hypothetical protein
MNTQTSTKTDFIKFNVSPAFKVLAEKKAREQGLTLSELGRMLFGSFVTGIAKPTMLISPEFIEMARVAKEESRLGTSKRIQTKKELDNFLETL